MDPLILEEKLESLGRCVERLETRRCASAAELAEDADAQDIVVLNLTRAVQLCADMAVHIITGSRRPPPRNMGESFEELRDLGWIDAALAARMRSAVGFRNLAVHAYQKLDIGLVHKLCYEGPVDLRAFARAISDRIDDPR